MKSTRLFVIIFAIALIAVIIYSLRDSQSPSDFTHEIQKERDEKDLFMKDGEDSPFKKVPFKGLNYYPPDLHYRITASIIPIDYKKVVRLSTSDGKVKKYNEYAYAAFSFGGSESRLLILELTDPGPYHGTLFLAFIDSTSGNETYGAGRYLDLKKIPGASTIVLDFNNAYNPYCAYSDDFSCPFPPKENVIHAAVRAGEKNYH